MKKAIYLVAGVALAASVSSCIDTKKPVYQEPKEDTEFIVNAPALADEFLATTGDLNDKSTFQLVVAKQPDYGFAAQANYNAQVSLTGEFTDEIKDNEGNVVTPATYRTLDNEDIHNTNMTFRTYHLAAAICALMGIVDEDTWNAYLASDSYSPTTKIYLRATCEIPGAPNSFIVSQNTVTYNNVEVVYCVPKAGVIYVCGDCSGWKEPSLANADFYLDYQLVEPEIGCKIYGGTFLMPDSETAHSGASFPDNLTQWRFFTELSGWGNGDNMVGSNEADFYIEPITDLFSDGANFGSQYYSGAAVYGKGNWGVWLDEPTEMTLAVSLVDKAKPAVWFRYGKWDVQIAPNAQGINEPNFVLPAEE